MASPFSKPLSEIGIADINLLVAEKTPRGCTWNSRKRCQRAMVRPILGSSAKTELAITHESHS